MRPPTRPTAGVGHGVKSCSVNSWKPAMNPASVDTQDPRNPQPNLLLVLLPRLAPLPAQLPTSQDSPAPAPQQPALPCEPILPGPHGGIHTSRSPGSPAGVSCQPHVEQEPLISPHALLLLPLLPVAATALPMLQPKPRRTPFGPFFLSHLQPALRQTLRLCLEKGPNPTTAPSRVQLPLPSSCSPPRPSVCPPHRAPRGHC